MAILCNHQKTVSKAAELGLEQLADRLTLLKKQKAELQGLRKALKNKDDKAVKAFAKDDSGEDAQEKAKVGIDKAKAAVEKAKTGDEKVAATKAMEAAKEALKKARADSASGQHRFKSTPNIESVEKRIETWADKIRKLELDIRNKDDNKEVALGTSKINYCDPRISVAWCKRCEVPIDRIFPKTLRDKFVWALSVPPDWNFAAITGKK